MLDPDGHNIKAVCHAPGNSNREQSQSAAAPGSQQVAQTEEEHGTKGMKQALHHLTMMTSGQGLFKAIEFFRYGERFRSGERISSAMAESTVNAVVSKRFAKRQARQSSIQSGYQLLPNASNSANVVT